MGHRFPQHIVRIHRDCCGANVGGEMLERRGQGNTHTVVERVVGPFHRALQYRDILVGMRSAGTQARESGRHGNIGALVRVSTALQ